MRQPNVWTCTTLLLPTLAARMVQGFPLAKPGVPLEDWTVLLPTRRAARMLERELVKSSGRRSIVSPKLQPIGDIDEDLLQDHMPVQGVPDALPPLAQLFQFLHLVHQWAEENPQEILAEDVLASPRQALGLAESLSEFFTQLETEDVEFNVSAAVLALDLAEHRLALTSLFGLVQERLPKLLNDQNLLSAARRRNHLIRLEAARIASGAHKGPIIAAGSTGTNPATRALLKAVALHPQGAVVLPGLDLALDADSWDVLGPEHPQYALKLLLADFGVMREDVAPLRDEDDARLNLISELMRPAATTAKWQSVGTTLDPQRAMQGVRMIEAPDRHLEARSIAVLMRETLQHSNKTAALITPDRDLAVRVAAEMQRWNLEVDDSGGAPLAHSSQARLLLLLADAVEGGFEPAHLQALVAHPDVTLGLPPVDARRLARLFEVVALRIDVPLSKPQHFTEHFAAAKLGHLGNRHAPPMIRDMQDTDWTALQDYVLRLAAVLSPLAASHLMPFSAHVLMLHQTLAALAPTADDEASAQLAELLEALQRDGARHPDCLLFASLPALRWAVKRDVLRPPLNPSSRLVIYGLPEARMMEHDLVILGGLNEAVWPPVADSGPWVNRSMRAGLGLQAPEREIGITAHDFAQGLAHQNVVLTWSARVGAEPRVASRWVLRLRALLQGLGVEKEQQLEANTVALARVLSESESFVPGAMPVPKPGIALRPTRFSVSDISKLVRDPYAIYASRVLKLLPLEPVAGSATPRLLGNLIHDAIGRWQAAGDLSQQALMLHGSTVFAPYLAQDDVRHFWWPRFARMAEMLEEIAANLHGETTKTWVEKTGQIGFNVAGVAHVLRCRADQIDVLKDGTLRIIDYKTGTIPKDKQVSAGFSPQLTLEALILAKGGFEDIAAAKASELMYLKVGGLTPPAQVDTTIVGPDVSELVAKHESGVLTLLALFQNQANGYRPRTAAFKDGDYTDYDHLSRYLEWSLGGAES